MNGNVPPVITAFTPSAVWAIKVLPNPKRILAHCSPGTVATPLAIFGSPKCRRLGWLMPGECKSTPEWQTIASISSIITWIPSRVQHSKSSNSWSISYTGPWFHAHGLPFGVAVKHLIFPNFLFGFTFGTSADLLLIVVKKCNTIVP